MPRRAEELDRDHAAQEGPGAKPVGLQPFCPRADREDGRPARRAGSPRRPLAELEMGTCASIRYGPATLEAQPKPAGAHRMEDRRASFNGGPEPIIASHSEELAGGRAGVGA